jgi:Family of unknown function (DUF5999)
VHTVHVRYTTPATGAPIGGAPLHGIGNCGHQPACPGADALDREAAHTVAAHPEQGWSLLCNGVVLFDDTGELLPDGRVVAPHRPTDLHVQAFAS